MSLAPDLLAAIRGMDRQQLEAVERSLAKAKSALSQGNAPTALSWIMDAEDQIATAKKPVPWCEGCGAGAPGVTHSLEHGDVPCQVCRSAGCTDCKGGMVVCHCNRERLHEEDPQTTPLLSDGALDDEEEA